MQQRDDCQTRLLFNLETSKIGSKNIGCLIFELAKTTKTKAREVAVMLEHLWNFFLQGAAPPHFQYQNEKPGAANQVYFWKKNSQ